MSITYIQTDRATTRGPIGPKNIGAGLLKVEAKDDLLLMLCEIFYLSKPEILLLRL